MYLSLIKCPVYPNFSIPIIIFSNILCLTCASLFFSVILPFVQFCMGKIFLCSLLIIVCYYLLVFQDKPALPPSQAQVAMQNMPSQDYSYLASIRRLLCNKPFVLLIITYGRPDTFLVTFPHLRNLTSI